jgi:hypothetical protein
LPVVRGISRAEPLVSGARDQIAKHLIRNGPVPVQFLGSLHDVGNYRDRTAFHGETLEIEGAAINVPRRRYSRWPDRR